MIKIEKCLKRHVIKVKKYDLLHNIINCWRKCIMKQREYKYKLYGRISSLDVEAVKKMVRKYTLNQSSLIKDALVVLFEISRHGKFYTFYSYYPHSTDAVDLFNNGTTNQPTITWKHRIEAKEKRALRLLRFLLKKGCDPNDKRFIENLVLKNNYHCKTFFIKILEMCYTYGLDENILLNILKENNKYFHLWELYYIMPVLDIHKNKLFAKDTVNLCIGWSTKKNFLYTLVNNGKGDLSILNDDVIGVIISFIYFI